MYIRDYFLTWLHGFWDDNLIGGWPIEAALVSIGGVSVRCDFASESLSFLAYGFDFYTPVVKSSFVWM